MNELYGLSFSQFSLTSSSKTIWLSENVGIFKFCWYWLAHILLAWKTMFDSWRIDFCSELLLYLETIVFPQSFNALNLFLIIFPSTVCLESILSKSVNSYSFSRFNYVWFQVTGSKLQNLGLCCKLFLFDLRKLFLFDSIKLSYFLKKFNLLIRESFKLSNSNAFKLLTA